jgi:hypothetical protein
MAWEDYISVNLDGYVSLFKILGDPVCLAVAGLLFEHEATATTIAMALELSPAKVRRSLEVLSWGNWVMAGEGQAFAPRPHVGTSPESEEWEW